MRSIPPMREIRADNPSPMTLDGTRTFIVGHARPVVIDPGPDDPRHLQAITLALGGGTPTAILLTHEHEDHAAGAARLAESTGAPLRLGRGAVRTRFACTDVEWLRDGEEVLTDAGQVRAVATPGHAPEHVAYHWTGEGAPEGGAVFVGDLMMGEGDTALVAPPEGNLRDYLASLDRVARLGAGVLYPAHGPPITEPREAIERYLTHRRERLAQVRSALGREPSAEADQLVDMIYGPDLDPRLRAAAAGSVAAMVEHLRSG